MREPRQLAFGQTEEDLNDDVASVVSFCDDGRYKQNNAFKKIEI